MGASALIIGLQIGVYDFAELFAKPFAGFIADRKGMRLTLLFGLGIAGLLAALIFGTFLRENSGQTEVSNLQ